MSVAIVTGGTRGIGAAISKQLKKQGYDVIANYKDTIKTAKTFYEETQIETLSWDVSTYEQCQESVDHIIKKYGKIDVLINNAGITRDGFLHKSTPQMWHEVIQTNLTSCFNMCHCVIPFMRKQKWGRIINISSVNGQKGQMGQVNYSAAKAGVIGLTRALALESASHGITVNAVAPGYVNTDMVARIAEPVMQTILTQIPMNRLGNPDEIAAVIGFLTTNDAQFITGATLPINGGQYMA